MASTFTANKAHLEKPAAGDYVDTWAPPINANWDVCDATTGANLSVTIDVANVTLTTSQAQNLIFNLTGTLTANRNLIFPAVGGIYVIYNNCSGSFTVTAITSAGGSTGVTVPVGGRSIIVSDGTNCYMADDNTLARFNSYAGNPNGNVAGTAATALNPASVIWDRTNQILYVCTTTGNAAAAIWAALNAAIPIPQGYLTPVSGTAIITADTTISSGGTLYYTPYVGNLLPISNGTISTPGTAFSTYSFSELSLVTSASQAASSYSSGAISTASIYDVYAFLDSGTIRLGFSPAWVAGTSGSGAPGSCARGTGAGGAALTRLNGILTNAAAMALLNGATTYNIGVKCGTYLGSVLIDSVAGQITCHRSYGTARKFGIWNAYHRVEIVLKEGDSTSTWNFVNGGGSATWRAANDTSANNVASFCGLAEQQVTVTASYFCNNNLLRSGNGIGVNSTTSPSGIFTINANTSRMVPAFCVVAPTLGVNNIYPIEWADISATVGYSGTEANMQLLVSYFG